jgi:hypothetical protein
LFPWFPPCGTFEPSEPESRIGRGFLRVHDEGQNPTMQRPAQPIFILGMMRRSGTNHLSDLLVHHPGCVSAAPINEDHLLQRALHLQRYVDSVTGSWTPSWGVPAGERARLLRSLGDGVVAFLQAGAGGRRVVAKTPRVENLDLFFDLFPDAALLVLVRDGRNVVASNTRSFDENEDATRHEWARAGRAVLAFDERVRTAGRDYRLVRYEDLLDDLVPTMTDIFRCCGLDPDVYDFAAAAELPVRGSSSVRGQDADVHWAPVAKTEDFRPNERWRDWTPYQHARFAQVAGDVQRALGYPLAAPVRSTARDRLRGAADDVTWALRQGRRKARDLRA